MAEHAPLTNERKKELAGFLSSTGFSETEQYEVFHRALTHSSFTYENRLNVADNYERLEFLGDAVLKLITSEYLFERFPEYREGDLTKIRAVVVSDAQLAELAKEINLGDIMIFGQSEERSGGRQKTSNLACGFEAFLGALFLDGKMGEIREFLVNLFEDLVTDVDLSKTKDNFKAALQEYTQSEDGKLPQYRTVKEAGPSHNRTFHVEAIIAGEVLGYGIGKSKKEAQQEAAKLALEALGIIESDIEDEEE